METKKITLSTVKSFVKKHSEIYINSKSDFNGMIDGIEYNKNSRFELAKRSDHLEEYTLGIVGAWFVRRSNDRFNEYEDSQFKGISVYNSCGSFIIAVRK